VGGMKREMVLLSEFRYCGLVWWMY